MIRMMKRIALFIAISLFIGVLTSCGNSKSGSIPERYHINYSETSPSPKEHKRVLIISGSPRKGGNTDLLCDAFARGAKEAGGNVEKIFLGDYHIDYFTEDDEQRVGKRADEAADDVPMLVDKMVHADVIVLAQGSMAYVEKDIQEACGILTLSSPRFGAVELKKALEEKGVM